MNKILKDGLIKQCNQTMITEDRLKLNAIEYENSIAAKKKIVTSFSFCISILLTLVTSDFHDFLGIDASVFLRYLFSF